jgi:UDP-N-acetylmuramyl pentapeptide phosphotransferase/UDP-N-acetylglucosamine-1-phosphate transferase
VGAGSLWPLTRHHRHAGYFLLPIFYFIIWLVKEMLHKIPTTEKKTSAPFKSSHFHKHFHKRKKDRQENLFFFLG